MPALEGHLDLTRRHFLATSASGLGTLALASVLRDEGLLSAAPAPEANAGIPDANPLHPRAPHFRPRARACIFIFMAGAPSQLDLFDPKPELNRLDGEKLPGSMIDRVRFAFIQKDSATLMGTPRTFRPRGRCGMQISDLLPHIGSCADEICLIRSMHTDAFNHHPGQLLLHTGVPRFGLPAFGSWLLYGLGSPSRNLPGYVVLTAGRGTSGGASLWSSGFLPSTYQGVPFRRQGDPVLNLGNPAGVTSPVQRRTLEALAALNRERFGLVGDPEITSRIASYELAFRMQAAAPELIDLSAESPRTLKAYGVDRDEGDLKGGRGGGKGTFRAFSTNCLLARRLVERGVRCVSIIHASWDHHSNLDPELRFNSLMCDQPIAALLKDLKQRGLLDSTLVIWGSEFGRTPLGENRRGRRPNTGRDHHPFAFSMWMAGGGARGGQVLGQTDDIGWNVVEDPVHINDLHATMLHLFGLDHLELTYRHNGRDFRLTDVSGHVIEKALA